MIPFGIPTRSLIGMILAAVAVLAARHYDGDRYDFGHPGIVNGLVLALLWILFVTHVMIGVLMWLQRERWLPSDAAMFRFIVAKAILWASFATAFQENDRGVRLETGILYLIVALTAVDLDIRMLRRYVFLTKDEREYPEWDRISERRGPEPGRRATDGRP